MLSVFLATVSPMLVMLCCIVIGYCLRKKNVLAAGADVVLSRVETYVFVPALTFNTFRNYCTVASVTEHFRYTLTATGVLIVSALIAAMLYKRFESHPYQQNVYRYALTFANYGFMGNAIVPAILGEEFLYPYMMYTLPLNVGVYTWGIALLIPKDKKTGGALKRLITPPLIALVLGAIVGISGANAHIPAFVSNLLEKCAACMAPVAMILTGVVVGGYSFKALITDRKVYLATALRLLVFPTVLLGALYLLGADERSLLFTLFAFGTPLGLNTVVFPAAYGGDTNTGASMAMISHVACVLTIPLLYALLTAVI